ncbi:hypothetical protein Q5H93_17855 [Hymenobacter sp. ASUV-10]|uniref:DUF4288 domain-containing protein n=1 Tax=Hymenobacter aranciens TaxID=3063996 RepID=A0ABT9BEB5_9BACT|nr:hypothetical protein [Hymenobacter sp. ASUV-10]MDO7876615.1 hypothetical protein [Hymenobacter sp. ASUV-10]
MQLSTSSFPFEVSTTDDQELPYQLLAKFDEPALAAYRALSDKYSREDYRVSLVDATVLIIEDRAAELLGSLEFDEEGYWLDMYVETEAALQLFISAICPVFQDPALLETYIRRVADGYKY